MFPLKELDIIRNSSWTEQGSWGPFLESPETFRARKAKVKSRTLRLQSCFIHTFLLLKKVHFRRIHFSVFTFRWTKIGFTGPKSFRGFRETGPWPCAIKKARRESMNCFRDGRGVSYHPIRAYDLDNKTKITQTHARQAIISAYSDKNGLTCETGRWKMKHSAAGPRGYLIRVLFVWTGMVRHLVIFC